MSRFVHVSPIGELAGKLAGKLPDCTAQFVVQRSLLTIPGYREAIHSLVTSLNLVVTIVNEVEEIVARESYAILVLVVANVTRALKHLPLSYIVVVSVPGKYDRTLGVVKTADGFNMLDDFNTFIRSAERSFKLARDVRKHEEEKMVMRREFMERLNHTTLSLEEIAEKVRADAVDYRKQQNIAAIFTRGLESGVKPTYIFATIPIDSETAVEGGYRIVFSKGERRKHNTPESVARAYGIEEVNYGDEINLLSLSIGHGHWAFRDEFQDLLSFEPHKVNAHVVMSLSAVQAAIKVITMNYGFSQDGVIPLYYSLDELGQLGEKIRVPVLEVINRLTLLTTPSKINDYLGELAKYFLGLGNLDDEKFIAFIRQYFPDVADFAHKWGFEDY